MIHVVWWTFALLAAAQARIYSRCELARDLEALGVRQDHISTWVCIAYHESRLDTAARNHYSGDHGIFQISELYWCGGGKVCGLSCDALRDDNIADDLQCARQVHEEHTRLQGDGFLAWVVYPQHCKGNTKKYLAECDFRGGYDRNINTYPYSSDEGYSVVANKNYQRTDNALPSFLAISSIFQERYGKALNHNKDNNIDWYNYKYDLVDELKLPVLEQKVHKLNTVTVPESVPVPESVKKVDKIYLSPVNTTTTRMTTTSTTEYVPPIKPWRFIETNQFRKKHTTPLDTTSDKQTTKLEKNAFEKITVSSKYSLPVTESTTHKSVTVTQGVSPKVKSTTDSYKSTANPTKPVTTTNIPHIFPAFTSYTSHITSPVPEITTTLSWWQRARTTSPRPTVATALPLTTSTTTAKSRYTFANRNTNWLPTSTVKHSPRSSTIPTASQLTTSTTTSKPRYTFANINTYRVPSTITVKYVKPSTLRSNTTPTVSPFTTSTSTAKPWYTFSNRNTNRLSTVTSKYTQLYTPRWSTPPTVSPFTNSITTAKTRYTFADRLTNRLQTSAVKNSQVYSSGATTKITPSPSSESVQRKNKSTQSIWDLYLNPTKAPKYQPIDFSRSDSKYNLKIFAGGTTTAIPTGTKKQA